MKSVMLTHKLMNELQGEAMKAFVVSAFSLTNYLQNPLFWNTDVLCYTANEAKSTHTFNFLTKDYYEVPTGAQKTSGSADAGV